MFAALITRPRLLTLVLTLPVFAAGVIHPTWARSAGLDVWNVPALQDQIRTSADESDRLDTAEHEVQRRIAMKESLVEELVAGRTTLSEVTAQFTAMNASRPNYVFAIRQSFPGDTDEEKVARNVIAYALARTAATECEAVARRLDAELQQMIAPSSH